MGSSHSPLWSISPALRLDRRDPYLRLQNVTLFVRDQDRSLQFFVDRLGFSLVADYDVPRGDRWVAVAPPDGTALLALVAPKPDAEEYKHVGQARQIVFLTEDVEAKYHEWLERGVVFLHPPKEPGWGGVFTSFEDPDGNSFALVGFDRASQEVEKQRQQTAEKLESERRAARELEIAKEVQARFFPQFLPTLSTLEYAGTCIQARQVGGDYYDFLQLGPDRLGMVIADVAGKGIAAALLMANLQASFRSQFALALEQPQRLLQKVNRLFCDNTPDGVFATLFFADYDDSSGYLRYANCGHLCGLLIRRDGSVERLASTSTVLGIFRTWDCTVGESLLRPGDLLALYTDGVTESMDHASEEYGEARLIGSLRRYRDLAPNSLITSVVADIRAFNLDEQHDDITLIVARRRLVGRF